MSIDERLEALTMNRELFDRDIQHVKAVVDGLVETVGGLVTASKQDAENIRALARIAELHHERLERLENQ